MELLLLLLLLPLIWLLLLPGRIAKGVRQYRFIGIGVLAIALVAGWFVLQFPLGPPQQSMDYAAGDTELRNILMQPENAPRYSSR
jgi:hypothetical protein